MAFDKERVVSRRRNRIFVKEFAKIVNERAAKGAKFHLPGGNVTPGLKRQLDKLLGHDVAQSIERDTPELYSRKRRRSSQTGESDSELETDIKSESDEEEGILGHRRSSGEEEEEEVEVIDGNNGEQREHQSSKTPQEEEVAEREDTLDDPGVNLSIEASREPSENQARSTNQPLICQLCGKEYRYKKPHLLKYHPAKFNRIDPTGKMPRREFNLKMDAMLMGIDLTKHGDGTFEDGEDEKWVRPEHRFISKPLLPRSLLAPRSMSSSVLIPQVIPLTGMQVNPTQSTRGGKKSKKKQLLSAASGELDLKNMSQFKTTSSPLTLQNGRLIESNENIGSNYTFQRPLAFVPAVTPSIMAHPPDVTHKDHSQMAGYAAAYPLGPVLMTSQVYGAMNTLTPKAQIMPRPPHLGPMSRVWDPNLSDSKSRSPESPLPLLNASPSLLPQNMDLMIEVNGQTMATKPRSGGIETDKNLKQKPSKASKTSNQEALKVVPESMRRLYEDPFA